MLIIGKMQKMAEVLDVVIIGASGFGKEILWLLGDCNKENMQYNILGFIDENIKKGTKISGIEVIGDNSYVLSLPKKPSIVLGIGAPHIKKHLSKIFVDFDFPSLIHPSVSITESQRLSLGKGVIICKGSILTCDIILQDFVTINLGCTIGHDSILHKYVSCMPAVNVSGEVVIEEGAYIGTGAKILQQKTIGTHSIIGAGAVVSKNLPSNCTAVGIPAKPIKYHE